MPIRKGSLSKKRPSTTDGLPVPGPPPAAVPGPPPAAAAVPGPPPAVRLAAAPAAAPAAATGVKVTEKDKRNAEHFAKLKRDEEEKRKKQLAGMSDEQVLLHAPSLFLSRSAQRHGRHSHACPQRNQRTPLL